MASRSDKRRREAGMIKLRSATRAEVLTLAQAKAWEIGPSTLDALRDRNSPERMTIARIDAMVLPGSIDMVVTDSIPHGFVRTRGPVLVTPTTGRGVRPDRSHAHRLGGLGIDWGTIARGIAILFLAVVIVLAAIGFMAYVFTLGGSTP